MKIEFTNISSYSSIEEVVLSHSHILALHGTPIDERGEAALQILQQFNIDMLYLKYNESKFNFTADTTSYTIKDFYTFIHSYDKENIIIEATTLSFAEVLYVLSAALKNETIKNIQILYIEPKEYKFKNSSITTHDEFELSEKFQQFPPLPGFTINAEHKNVELIAFLGFEKNRLGQIFTLDETTYTKFTPIIPLPGFLPGWENRTIDNHLKFFTPKYFFTELKYVSANNPYQSYKLLDKLSQTKENFRVAPIGTKPNAIGCAVFLVNNEDQDNNYGALFDFPVKTPKRSNGIGKSHIYNLKKS